MAFTFGAPAAPASGFNFGATPAPAPGGLSFGAAPAASAPAPAAPASAPSTGGLFGASAPAPPSLGLFGPTPAPAAPSSGSLFGTPAPAPGGIFGTPAPATLPATTPQHAAAISGSTPYSHLPNDVKKAFDTVYQLIMQHRRTLSSVKSMAPSLLVERTNDEDTSSKGTSVVLRGERSSPADVAAGLGRHSQSTKEASLIGLSGLPLPQQITILQTHINNTLKLAEANRAEAQHVKTQAGEATCQAQVHGSWPIDIVASRRGIVLSSLREMVGDFNSQTATTSADTAPGGSSEVAPTKLTIGNTSARSKNASGMANADAFALQRMMDLRASSVDRIEAMPSPYLWDVLHSFEQRLASAQKDIEAIRSRLTIAEEASRMQNSSRSSLKDEASLFSLKEENYAAMASLIVYEGGAGAHATLSKQLATLARSQSDLFLVIAAQIARIHEGLQEIKLRYRQLCEAKSVGLYNDPFLRADAEEVSQERKLQQRINEAGLAQSSAKAGSAASAAVPQGGLFGATAAPTPGALPAQPAPATSTGAGLFAPAPNPASSLFSSPLSKTPAPAGGLFSATPAPASTGLFGFPAPAPPASSFSFGAPSATAPATGALFGTPAPAPASTLAPRKKSSSRSGGRRR